MVHSFKNATPASNWAWYDIETPTPEELEHIAVEFNLHPAAVQDCLQPDHLPKFEEMGEYNFMIMRLFNPDEPQSTSMRKLTHKVAIFFNEQCVITIHRKPQPFIYRIAEGFLVSGKCQGAEHLVTKILKQAVLTFDSPTEEWQRELDYYEGSLIRRHRPPSLPKGLYQVKQQASSLKRLLLVTFGSFDAFADSYENDPYMTDLRDTAKRVMLVYDDILESTNSLLNLYLSLSSVKTNEIMRVLTILSALFLPLTFIVGVFGMNYSWMPTIADPNGFWYVCGGMVILTVGLIAYFRHKSWM
jgi:magnesium transporter